MENPFRPEGQLAKEADEFVTELKLKTERELNELLQNTSASTISQSHTVNEILAEPKSPSGSTTTSPTKKKPTSTSTSPESPPPPVAAVSATTTTTPAHATTLTTTHVEIKVEQKKITEKPVHKPADTINNITPTKTNTNKAVTVDDGGKGVKSKKTKSKCGCILS